MNTLPRRSRALAFICLLMSLSSFVSVAQAHAKLVNSTPPANSSVSSPKFIQIHFNEAVEAKLSRIKLAMFDGTVIPVTSMNDAKDPSALSVMPSTPLTAGRYTVTWSAVTDDGHKTQGSFTFTVQ